MQHPAQTDEAVNQFFALISAGLKGFMSFSMHLSITMYTFDPGTPTDAIWFPNADSQNLIPHQYSKHFPQQAYSLWQPVSPHSYIITSNNIHYYVYLCRTTVDSSLWSLLILSFMWTKGNILKIPLDEMWLVIHWIRFSTVPLHLWDQYFTVN